MLLTMIVSAIFHSIVCVSKYTRLLVVCVLLLVPTLPLGGGPVVSWVIGERQVQPVTLLLIWGACVCVHMCVQKEWAPAPCLQRG